MAAQAPAEAPAAAGPLIGDPGAALLRRGLGSVSLGLALLGVVPAAAIGAAIPIILTATSIGLFLATIWAASLGQTAVASVFGIFAGFWLSYAVLVLGLTHNWFGVLPAQVQATQELFLVAWLVVMVAHPGDAPPAARLHRRLRPRRRGPAAGVPRRERRVLGPPQGGRLRSAGVRRDRRVPVRPHRFYRHRRRPFPLGRPAMR